MYRERTEVTGEEVW